MLRRLVIWVAIAACSKGPLDGERAKLDESARLEASAKLDRVIPAARELMTARATRLRTRVQQLAALPELAAAIKAEPGERQTNANLGFMKFLATEVDRPEVIALVDLKGNVVAMHESASPAPRLWRSDDSKTKTVFPALDLVLSTKRSIAEAAVDGAPIWLGAATVVDGEQPIGAAVVMHAIRATRSKRDTRELGAEVGYAVDSTVFVTTLGDHAFVKPLSEWLASKPADSAAFAAGDTHYVVRTLELPRASEPAVPAGYPPSPVRLLLFGKVTGLLER